MQSGPLVLPEVCQRDAVLVFRQHVCFPYVIVGDGERIRSGREKQAGQDKRSSAGMNP